MTTSMTVPVTTPSSSLTFSMSPGRARTEHASWKDQTAFFVFLGENQSFDLIANGNNFAGVNVVLDGKLAGRDDTFGLVTDVEQDFVAVDLDDGTFDEVAVVEVLDGGVDSCEEVLSGTDVVNGDYGGTGLLGGGDGHVVGAPLWIVCRSGKPLPPGSGRQNTAKYRVILICGLIQNGRMHVVHARLF